MCHNRNRLCSLDKILSPSHRTLIVVGKGTLACKFHEIGHGKYLAQLVVYKFGLGVLLERLDDLG